jgi:hypothetical protein
MINQELGKKIEKLRQLAIEISGELDEKSKTRFYTSKALSCLAIKVMIDNELDYLRILRHIDRIDSITKLKHLDITTLSKYSSIGRHLTNLVDRYKIDIADSTVSFDDMDETLQTTMQIEGALDIIQDYFVFEGFPIQTS